MKRVLIVAALAAVLVIGGAVALRLLHESPSSQASALADSVPAPCPSVNDLQGIEGYAPGAGGAERQGQTAGSMFGSLAGGTNGSTPAPTSKPKQMCRILAPAVESYFASIAQAASYAPPPSDVQSLAQSIGSGPTAIFTYVRDEIRTEPYAGTMRGTFGTLASRGGSPDDKALLLAGLLQAQNVPVQFVHAPLAQADIARILTAAQQPVPAAQIPNAPTPPPQVPMDQLRTVAKAFDAVVDRQFDAEIARIQRRSDALLQKSGVQLAANDDASRNAMTAALADHWWVQAQINGTWVDMDPSVAGMQPGSHLGAAPTDAPVSALPDALGTQITLRLNASYADNTTAGLLTVTTTSAQVYDKSIRIGFDNSALPAQIPQTATFTPYIEIAGDRTSGSALDLGAGGAKLTGVTLQIAVSAPGRAPYTYTRRVFDSAAGDDPAYALQTLYYGMIVSGEVGSDVAMRHEANGTAALHALLAYSVTDPDVSKGVPQAAAMRFPIPAMRYLAMDERARSRYEQQRGVHFYVDRPQIVFFQHSLIKSNSGVRLAEGIDVFDNAMTAIAPNGASAVRANMERGYIDDEIENSLVNHQAVITAMLTENDSTRLQSVSSTNAASLPVAANVRANLTDSLTANSIAIAPAAAPRIDGRERFGWWVLDPSTGNMIGRMESGAGQAMPEYAVQTKSVLRAVSIVQLITNCAECLWGAATSPLSGVDTVHGLGICIAAAACSYLSNMYIGKGLNAMTWWDAAIGYSIVSKLGWTLGQGLGYNPSPTTVLCKKGLSYF